mmetsp:Transcript_7768/g.8878  ORF Transcript_7768/g.8878 Transcript_7768/m.8878 type:complete len:269 (-) Transcript_7768:291-1097(-)
MEALRDRSVHRVHLEGQVGGEHDGGMLLAGIMRVGNKVGRSGIRRNPQLGTSRTLDKLELVLEQILEEPVVPLGRAVGPRALQTTGDGVLALAAAKAVLPAQALLFNGGRLRGWPHVRIRVSGAVAFPERVSACNQCHRLLIIHRHACKRFADILGGRQRVWVTIRPLWVHVDETHLHGSQRLLQRRFVTFTAGKLGVVPLVRHPHGFWPPVHVSFGFPNVLAPSSKAKRLEAHRFDRAVASKDHQIGPGELFAVLLLDWPQQSACLV